MNVERLRRGRARSRTSFASDVRHELALEIPDKPCCQVSELQGVIAAAPTTTKGDTVVSRLTSSVAARKVVRLIRLHSGERVDSHDAHFIRGRTAVRPTYQVSLWRHGPEAIPDLAATGSAPAQPCCRRAFVRGAFIATGTVSSTTGGQHIELAVTSQARARAVAEAITELGLRPRIRRRGGRWFVYLKAAEDLVSLLKAMGASQAVLHFENDRILRELRGQANRQANTDTGNMRRVIATSFRQASAVRRLTDVGALETQPQALREVAAVRVAMPSASLQQIAMRMGLTKSAVNARLRRLVSVAAKAGLIDSA